MSSHRQHEGDGRRSWSAALAGQFGFVFAAAALSGPGRIDIVDGQTRYEVARSLVEHGDSVIRDPHVWFSVFPGRNGQLYTNYRFPQTAAGVASIIAADTTGPVCEGRRHFFFTLTSALACAVLATTYAIWFRHLGHGRRAALFWSGAGIFCTPNWFYGTSTFDDILGAAAVVPAVAVAFMTRQSRSWWGPAASGALLGLAFNCKQPLGLFALPVLAIFRQRRVAAMPATTSTAETAVALVRTGLALAGLAAGILAQQAYEAYKFPPGTREAHTDLWQQYGPVWTANPLPALLTLTISPGAGALCYCPTLLLCFCGLAWWYRRERLFSLAICFSSGAFALFICFLAFYKGDPSWGPRYLTPVFALLWLFAPAGAPCLRRRLVVLILALGLVVQLLALSVDPQRLHLQRALPASAYGRPQWLYFHPALSHLLNRPVEIGEVLTCCDSETEAYTPAVAPTFATPSLPLSEAPRAVRKYRVFCSFRPWWSHQQYLSDSERPVVLVRTALLLMATGLLGLVTMIVGTRVSGGGTAAH